MTFYQGQKLLYGAHGVCEMVGIESRKVERKMVEFYCLCPVEQKSAMFYIPVSSQAATSKLHPLMSKDELSSLLASVKGEDTPWIADENSRKQHYRVLMSGLDRKAMLCTVGAVLRQKDKQQALGKKLHLCDENFLRDAQKLIAGEFSLVLGIPKEDVRQYIQKQME